MQRENGRECRIRVSRACEPYSALVERGKYHIRGVVRPAKSLWDHNRKSVIELELIQTQMTQKPMLRAEVYARALRASQNRKEDSV
jgi:hypothetical protein